MARTRLNKEIYYFGEPVEVHVSLQNDSARDIKDVRISVVQTFQVKVKHLPSSWNSRVVLSLMSSEEGFPVKKGQAFDRSYTINVAVPSAADAVGVIAVDGMVKAEERQLVRRVSRCTVPSLPDQPGRPRCVAIR